MPETFGQRLKRLRLERGLTQTQVCERAGIAGGSYYCYENGTRGCTAYTLYLLAVALDVSMDYLWRGKEPNARKEEAQG